MYKFKHKPPSRIRYEKNNPVVSFRAKKEWYNEFKAFLKDQGWSIGDFFRMAFKKQKVNYKRAEVREYKRGYTDGDDFGYNRAVSEWRIWYFCNICREVMYISPNSDSHKDLIDYLKERGWGHPECHKKNSSDTY